MAARGLRLFGNIPTIRQVIHSKFLTQLLIVSLRANGERVSDKLVSGPVNIDLGLADYDRPAFGQFRFHCPEYSGSAPGCGSRTHFVRLHGANHWIENCQALSERPDCTAAPPQAKQDTQS